MKMRKLLAVMMAMVMALSMAIPAFAEGPVTLDTYDDLTASTGTATKSTGKVQGFKIKVVVPDAQDFVINPYGLTVSVKVDGEDVFSNDQIFCAPAAIVSQSNVPIQVSAKVKGVPASGSSITLVDSPEKADPRLEDGFDFEEYSQKLSTITTKDVFLYMAFASLTSDDEGKVEDYPQNWSEYVEPEDGAPAETILVGATDSKVYVVGELSAMTSEDGTEYTITDGNAIGFNVCGCANPYVGSWGATDDKVEITTTFTFKTLANG